MHILHFVIEGENRVVSSLSKQVAVIASVCLIKGFSLVFPSECASDGAGFLVHTFRAVCGCFAGTSGAMM